MVAAGGPPLSLVVMQQSRGSIYEIRARTLYKDYFGVRSDADFAWVCAKGI